MFDDLVGRVGGDATVGEWHTITQDQIDQFADATSDHQWIHVDPERAAAGPFGDTIAHGFLTLSLLSTLVDPGAVPNVSMAINYGLDRVRFISPVPVGARVRARTLLADVTEVTGGVQIKFDVTVEVKGSERPACVAEWLIRYLN